MRVLHPRLPHDDVELLEENPKPSRRRSATASRATPAGARATSTSSTPSVPPREGGRRHGRHRDAPHRPKWVGEELPPQARTRRSSPAPRRTSTTCAGGDAARRGAALARTRTPGSSRWTPTAAKALPGVHAVLTGREAAENIDPLPGSAPRRWSSTRSPSTRCVTAGEAVVAVAAESPLRGRGRARRSSRWSGSRCRALVDAETGDGSEARRSCTTTSAPTSSTSTRSPSATSTATSPRPTAWSAASCAGRGPPPRRWRPTARCPIRRRHRADGHLVEHEPAQLRRLGDRPSPCACRRSSSTSTRCTTGGSFGSKHFLGKLVGIAGGAGQGHRPAR